jgi:hypothetical protein
MWQLENQVRSKTEDTAEPSQRFIALGEKLPAIGLQNHKAAPFRKETFKKYR